MSKFNTEVKMHVTKVYGKRSTNFHAFLETLHQLYLLGQHLTCFISIWYIFHDEREIYVFLKRYKNCLTQTHIKPKFKHVKSVIELW